MILLNPRQQVRAALQLALGEIEASYRDAAIEALRDSAPQEVDDGNPAWPAPQKPRRKRGVPDGVGHRFPNQSQSSQPTRAEIEQRLAWCHARADPLCSGFADSGQRRGKQEDRLTESVGITIHGGDAAAAEVDQPLTESRIQPSGIHHHRFAAADRRDDVVGMVHAGGMDQHDLSRCSLSRLGLWYRLKGRRAIDQGQSRWQGSPTQRWAMNGTAATVGHW